MNRFIRSAACLLLLTTLGLHAQDSESANQAASEKIRTELDRLMGELPLQTQLEVLKFAQRQHAEAQRTAREQAQAQPAPQPAKPQTVQVTPQPAPTPSNQPARPAYMEQAEAMPQTTVDWGETNHDFGEIEAGTVVKHVYRFRNTGDQPLKLTRVKASCGCTTPSWSKEPIQPGEEGFIEVAFNSRGKKGPQRKTVVVNGNFEPVTQILRFQGTIVVPTLQQQSSDEGQ